MGVGFKVGGSAVFKSYVTIQANPSAIVTLTHPSITYTAQADGYGVANFVVKKKGTYTVGTNNTASVNTEGNTATLDVLKSNRTYNGQMVKINIPGSLGVGNYSSNVLALYWDKPNSNWTGCDLRYGSKAYPASRSEGESVSIGAGGDIDLTSASKVNGFKHSGLTKDTAYYYTIFPYITINNVKYWATSYRSASGTARYYIGTVVTITNTNNSWAVPTGWRKAQAFCVGGGGGGSSSGGGGAGGRTATSGEFNVTPGATYVATVGDGGSAGGTSGGTGGTTSFGSIVSAAGGAGGNGLHGGSGGSGGGAAGIYRGDQYDCDGTAGASDGGNAKSNSYVRANSWHYHNGGTGQGSTTRAWKSASGTLYAGGGGGGSRNRNYSGGSGGAGGGGRGASSYTENGANGTANTGGGGGGGAYDSGAEASSRGGSGGKGIILVKCVA